MSEEASTITKEIARLRRSRGNYKGHSKKGTTKLLAMDRVSTRDLDYSVIETMLESTRNTVTNLEELYEALADADPTHEEEHRSDLDQSLEAMETLQDLLTAKANKGHACHELETILEYLNAFRMKEDSSPQQMTSQIQRRDDQLCQVRGKYRGAIRSDEYLQGVVEAITEKLAELNSTLPGITPSPGAAGRRGDDGGRDREVRTPHHRRLPTIETPHFHGDILEWEEFWSTFKRNVHDNKDLEEDEKRSYLQQAVKDTSQTNLVDSLAGSYSECVASLKARYHQPRRIHQHFVLSLLKCKPCRDDSKQELTRVHSTLAQSWRRLVATKRITGEQIIESFAESVLPPGLWRKWTEAHPDPDIIPPLATLLEFIEFQANLAQRGEAQQPSRPDRVQEKPRHDKKHQPYVKQEREVRAVTVTHPCLMCKETGHNLYSCPKLLAQTVDQRTEFVMKARLCFNCLCPHHDKRACKSTYRCRTCNKPHHTLLHKERAAVQYDSNDPPATRANANVVRHVTTSHHQVQETVSPTLRLVALAPSGRETPVTALYDTGADLSFITNQVANRLGLRRRRCNVSIVQALGSTQTNTNLVDFTLTSSHVPGEVREMTAVVVPHLGGGDNPLKTAKTWSFLSQLPLADPEFQRRRKLDLILGQDILNQIGLTGQKEGDTLMAHETIWGWTVQGPVGRSQRLPSKETTATSHCTSTAASVAVSKFHADREGDDLLRAFFESESLEEELTPTQEEQAVLEHFARTHKVLPGGRFQVTLPRRQDRKELGESRGAAMRRYLQNEKSLIRRKALQPFQRVMEEYFSLQHAEVIPQDELHLSTIEHYYMPLHAVTKETSTTTKLRVVFDASATTSSGTSLNDTLLTGPTVHPPLTDILIRFRTHQIGITADISKMYREIVLNPDDRNLHRFLWRKNPTDPIVDCRMKRVTFGVSSSPFLATQVIQQISQNIQTEHPKASHSLHTEFYVDDFLSGADTTAEAIHIQAQVYQVLEAHKLTLRKWRSSSTEVLQAIHPDLRETEPVVEDYGHHHLKTLGVHWDAKHDHFHVSISELQLPSVITKRALASDVARTFDVMGWFAPATLTMKAAIQQLWAAGIGWDDPVPPSIQAEWSQWRKELPQLASQPIPRSYFCHSQGSRTEVTLHGFSDASIKGYAAVVYARATYHQGPPTVSLIQAKTKVAPLKGLTVPRLELCGAVLLSSLITTVRAVLKITLPNIWCWTDSQIVLHWLDGKSRPHRTFVANRVRQTLDKVPSSQWKHVPGIDNPADCASRGINPGALQAHGLWWHGPAWLSQEPIIQPPQPQLAHLEKSSEELVKGKRVAAITTTSRILEDRYSTYRQLIRTVAWCLRFRRNTITEPEDRPRDKVLSITDVAAARIQLYQRAQERTILKTKCRSWERDKRIRSLNPTKDETGLYRVNGRLRNSPLGYAQRCPIILGGDDCLTKLLIRHHHIANGHGGPTLVMSAIGRDHYLISGMATVKAICRNCVVCTRFRNETETQLMGQLPTVRVTPSSPFSEVGTDFAGPIMFKKGHTRRPVIVKGYVCAFVCLSTKAVHLEVVGDLTTEAFLSCLTRFVSRRGLPNNIYSDNGSNYVGASRELEEIYSLMRNTQTQEEVISYCTGQHIGWHFSPARAPHFGGIWESAIKSFKTHFKRMANGLLFTLEDMITILTRIEAALNSRPLMPVYSHSEEGVDVLTPGHFLIGRPLNALPEHQIEQTRNPRSRYVLCQKLAQQFWQRWSTDYLRQLHKRTKWQKEKSDVEVGDIVLIRGDTPFTPNSWPMARVVKIYQGKDGLVRAVDVQTGSNVYRRPITKLTILVRGQPATDTDESGTGTPGIPLPPAGMTESEDSDLEES